MGAATTRFASAPEIVEFVEPIRSTFTRRRPRGPVAARGEHVASNAQIVALRIRCSREPTIPPQPPARYRAALPGSLALQLHSCGSRRAMARHISTRTLARRKDATCVFTTGALRGRRSRHGSTPAEGGSTQPRRGVMLAPSRHARSQQDSRRCHTASASSVPSPLVTLYDPRARTSAPRLRRMLSESWAPKIASPDHDPTLRDCSSAWCPSIRSIQLCVSDLASQAGWRTSHLVQEARSRTARPGHDRSPAAYCSIFGRGR